MKSIVKRIAGIIVGFIALMILLFILWAVIPFRVMPEAEAALMNKGSVLVTSAEHIVFYPETNQSGKGMIFYPGARVDSEAYAPLARSLTENGWVVVLVNMPLDLAFFDLAAADEIIPNYPEVRDWYIGGHSLGGAMAAEYCRITEFDSVTGLLLLGSYPGKNTDLSDSGLSVLSITSSEDLIATQKKIADAEYLLPEDTLYHVIAGGNHAGFGWYGEQKGDGVSTIDRRDQTNEVLQTILTNWHSLGLSSF